MKQVTANLSGVEIELFDGGAGKPLLFLHSGGGFDPRHPFVDGLTTGRRLIAPSHPGFGVSALPDWIDCVDDIAYLYIELLDQLGLETVDVVGCSIGGWIASEIVSKVPERFGRMVLVGPVGVKLGPEDRLDVPDIFVVPPDDVHDLMFHDPDKFRFNPEKLSDEELTAAVRNRETLALLTWEPYMHNPKLRRRLDRATMPVLLMRGVSDGLISADYLAAYAGLFSDSRTAEIADAGHAPQIEQPERFNEVVLAFLNA